MGDRIGTGLPGGLLIPAKLVHDTLRPVGALPVDSSYSQATSRPGHGTPTDDLSRLVAHIHASQAEDMLLRTIKAGMPGRNGVQVAVRKTSETADQFMGWNGPGYQNGVAFVEFGALLHTRFDAVTIPSTQEVVVFRTTGSTNGAARTIDPDARTVGALGQVLLQGADWNYPALVVIPETERILLQFADAIRYSDDKGATWSIYSEEPADTSATDFGRSRMAYYRSDIGMLVEDTATAGTVHQLASSDLGATFTEVDAHAGFGSSVSFISTEDGLFAMYIRDADGFAVVRRISSPFEDLSDVTEVVISATTYADAALSADPDGTLYAHIRRTTPSAAIELWVSTDAGATWLQMLSDTFNMQNGSDDFLKEMQAVSSYGSIVLISNWVTSPSPEIGLVAVWLGGWQAVTSAGSQNPRLRPGFQENWIPVELPQNTSATWTETGTASALVSPGELERITTGLDVSYHSRTVIAATPDTEQLILWEGRIDSGGTLGTKRFTINGRMADGAFDYQWSLTFDTTGYRVEDEVAAAQIGSDELMDLTSEIVLLIWADQGTIRTFWWRPGEHGVNIGPTGALADGGVSAGGTRINWGHETPGSVTSHSKQLHFIRRGVTVSGNTIYEPQTGVDNIRGKPLTRIPIPIPGLGVAPLAGYMSATAGPGRRDDGYDVPAAYDYPITNVFPRLSPSPDSRWRSQDLTEQVLTFRFAEPSWIGDSIGMYISGANFRGAFLESSSDGSTWTTRGQINLSKGFEGLDGVRTGDSMLPDPGTTPATRYLFEGQTVGGHAYLSPTVARRIAGQTAGGWSPTTTVLPVIDLADVAGGDPLAPTGVKLVMPAGLLVIHLTSRLIVDWWRVRIPAQISPDSYFEAGCIMVGKLVPFGDRIDWGRGDELIPNTLQTRDPYGTSRVRELGPPAKRWSIHWQQGTNHCEIRKGPDVDYVSADLGLPLAGDEDVLYQLFGLIKETKGGEVPCLAIEEIPDENQTLNDDTRFLYGRLTSSARGNNVAGDLGTDEQQRIESLVFDEIK